MIMENKVLMIKIIKSISSEKTNLKLICSKSDGKLTSCTVN